MSDSRFYKIVRPIIKVLFIIIYRPRFIGKENIPKDEAVLLVGNHTNNFDCLFLISATKRNIHFLAKDSLLKGIKKYIFKAMGIIPIDRKTKNNKKAMDDTRKILNANGCVGIFPEGTINRTKDIIMPFKMGSVKLAYDTKSYIVPFSITGKYKIFNNNLKIIFGKKYKISHNDLEEENKILMNRVTELIMKGNTK